MIPLEHDSLELALSARLDRERRAWFDEAVARVRAAPSAIASVFPAVGRGVGRGPLNPDDGDDPVRAWSVDDAARTLLLVALGDAAESELELLYRHGDARERRGVLRSLAFIDVDPGLSRRLVDDGLRTNDVALIAAAMGPFAAERLDDAAYAQGVLKCVFVGVPLAVVAGTEERATPELAAMLGRYVHERIAAGRTVPEDVWPLIDRHPPAAELHAIEAELHSPHDDRRRAAQAALAGRPPATPNQ
ncbi:MAG TPA: EboA domain-containing protein [Solirubrobacteraceae bacterium]|nr:EboA domain-containing protein [Solirubrobacteraceae bacterium]